MSGATNITQAVVNGTHTVGPLAPGATAQVQLTIRAKKTANVLTTATSNANGALDAVLASVRVNR